MSDWNNLLQKLNTRPSEQGQRLDENASQLNFLLQNFSAARSNGASPEIRSLANEVNINDREDLSVSNRSENILPPPAISYIDEIPDLQITNVKSSKANEKEGRTMAINSRFICFCDKNDTLTIKSLKNLSLVHIVHDLGSKIVDLAFLEAPLTNYLALICANGVLVVFNIDLTHSKDKILVKYRLKYSIQQPIEKAQIEWKDKDKIGVVVGKELKIFDILPEKPNPEPTEDPPKPISQDSFEFDNLVRDFAFSPGYPLVYILFENNVVRIINLENTGSIKEFSPHESSGDPVMKILAYKSLVRHQAIKSNEEVPKDQALRDIFLTITKTFEIKVWDLSEWDSENDTYYCIETFQLNQNNDKLDPITLIDRFVFYDPGQNFVFVGFRTNGEKGICVAALHVEQFYCGYNEAYDSIKKSKRFFNSIQTIWFRKNDLTDLSVLNFGDDEIDSYFKKNSYVQLTDFEPASTRTQDGSYACNSKSVLTFFVHNDDVISVYKVLGEKLYPFTLVEEFDKITQAEQLDNQSSISRGELLESSFPDMTKKKDGNKPIKVFSESEYGRIESTNKREGSSEIKKNPKEVSNKDDTNSPDPTKVQSSHKKKHEHKKEREANSESHDNKQKAVPTKIVMRGDNQKNQNQNPPIQAAGLKSLETIEREMQASKKEEAQVQNIDRAIERKFQELSEKSLLAITAKFNKLEETIESRVNERVSKLQLDSLSNSLTREIDDKLQREFANSFEKTVTPCFEKYLMKMFDQVCSSFDKGHKYYIDKLNVEQAKGAQLKETMNEVIKSFVQVSNALTEGLMNNQNNFNRLESNVQEKQNQITRLIEQMNEILQKQQDLQKKIDGIEKDMQDTLTQYQSEIGVFRDITGRYLERFNDISPPNEGKTHEESKRDNSSYSSNLYNYPYSSGNPYYNPQKTSKEKGSHPLNEQLVHLQNIMFGRPLDMSGGPMFRGAGAGMPVMSPASSQMLNPYQTGYGYYDNPYQKAKANFYAAQTQQAALNQPSGINAPQNTPALYNPSQNPTQVAPQSATNPQSGQLLQAFYQFLKQAQPEKEEDKGNLNSPFLPNSQNDNAKKFFGMDQPQVQPSPTQQTPSSQRSLNQMETQQHKVHSQNQSFTQDNESGAKQPQHLPPGMQANLQGNMQGGNIQGNMQNNMQGNNQTQQNYFQALLQNLPQFQQGLAQTQGGMNQGGLNLAKPQGHFPHNIQPNTGGPQDQGQQNVNQMGMDQHMYYPNIFAPNMPPNLGNFGGYNQGFPPQMNNPTINKMSGSKPSSTLDISQIPLVNSMFKTPSRDTTTEENNDQNGNAANNSE